jgi:hypothetical protein
MKQKTNVSVILALLMAIAFIACNEQAKKDEPAKTDASKTEAASMQEYANNIYSIIAPWFNQDDSCRCQYNP